MNIDPYLAFLILGALLIACEVLILQASIGWLLLLGISAIITALILWFIPALSMAGAMLIFISSSVVTIALLYKPMRRWQNKPSAMKANDAYGQEATVTQTIAKNNKGKIEWSGTNWDAALDDSASDNELPIGAKVTIVSASGITLNVK